MKKLFLALALSLPVTAFAQWRVGVNAGADLNHYSINTQFQSDYRYKDRWGVTMALPTFT